jgi:hypothetical protein
MCEDDHKMIVNTSYFRDQTGDFADRKDRDKQVWGFVSLNST